MGSTAPFTQFPPAVPARRSTKRLTNVRPYAILRLLDGRRRCPLLPLPMGASLFPLPVLTAGRSVCVDRSVGNASTDDYICVSSFSPCSGGARTSRCDGGNDVRNLQLR